jgi:hypothetical protein
MHSVQTLSTLTVESRYAVRTTARLSLATTREHHVIPSIHLSIHVPQSPDTAWSLWLASLKSCSAIDSGTQCTDTRVVYSCPDGCAIYSILVCAGLWTVSLPLVCSQQADWISTMARVQYEQCERKAEKPTCPCWSFRPATAGNWLLLLQGLKPHRQSTMADSFPLCCKPMTPEEAAQQVDSSVLTWVQLKLPSSSAAIPYYEFGDMRLCDCQSLYDLWMTMYSMLRHHRADGCTSQCDITNTHQNNVIARIITAPVACLVAHHEFKAGT